MHKLLIWYSSRTCRTLLGLMLIASNPLLARSNKTYHITRVHIDAKLQADGSMEVVESRTFNFRGSFSFAYRILPLTESAVYDNLAVFENGQAYRLSDTNEPDTYQISGERRQIKVQWFFRAKNETRTFDFHYRALDLVNRHSDAAVLYIKFIGDEWDRLSQNVSLRLTPPAPIEADQINEWLHGPLWATSAIEKDGSITAWCENLPARTLLEIRAIYPPELFDQMTERNGFVRKQIMAEEVNWAEDANRKREQAIQSAAARDKRWQMGKALLPIISIAGLMAWFFLFRKYGTRPPMSSFMKVSSDMPSSTPPALVGYLLTSRQVYPNALVATLLDMAWRGYLTLQEERVEKKGVWGGRKEVTEYYWNLNREQLRARSSELAEYESDLLSFIFDDLANGQDSISLEMIKKKHSKFTSFFSKWQKKVKGQAKSMNYYDRASLTGMYYSFAIAGVLLLLTIAAALLFGPWAVVLGATTILVFILSLSIPHRTAEGEKEARGWQAFKRYLQKYQFRSADRTTILNRIDSIFVYGVVLGVSKKIYSELANYVPAESYHHYVPWYVYTGGTGGFSAESFSSAFSTMIATTSSAMSTASGAGGGASGGGGGGAGGGGGGAG
jgi:uncharacterized membrane protein